MAFDVVVSMKRTLGSSGKSVQLAQWADQAEGPRRKLGCSFRVYFGGRAARGKTYLRAVNESRLARLEMARALLAQLLS